MKSISTINPVIVENTECLTITPIIKIVGVSLDHSVSHYTSFPAILYTLGNITNNQ